MSGQVITVSPSGIMSGLQVKPGKGIDLRQFGNAEIIRASEIVWDAKYQGWYVDVLHGAGRGSLTTAKWREAGLEGAPKGCQPCLDVPDTVYLFEDYDLAVAAEIAYLDALRVAGNL